MQLLPLYFNVLNEVLNIHDSLMNMTVAVLVV